MISRRAVLSAAACSVLPRTLSPAAPAKPNFVFILADDHAGYVLGCDGNRLARTPNLDRLASQGVRFSRHYCNSPVCTPSRQSFFTGQMPHMAGVTVLTTPLSPEKPTVAKQFQQAGYATAVFGKMHFVKPDAAASHGFDTGLTEEALTREWRASVTPLPLPAGEPVKPPWKPFHDPARIWLNADKLPFPRHDADMRASYQLQQVDRYLEGHKDQPFALWVSFLEPHSPYDFPLEFRDRYQPGQFTVPKLGPEDAAQIPLIFRELSDADKQGIAASYYTSVEYLDRNVGRVLDKLKHLGLEDNTLVVYMADHGYNLGQHGRFEKHSGFDPALRVPLLMRYPGRIQPSVINELTEHIDVPATIIDLLNLKPLPITHGQSLRPYLEGKPAQSRDHIFSEYLENEEAYIRTDQWKFVYCTGQRERKDGYVTADPTPGRYKRLFNLKEDPGEFHNLIKDRPKMAGDLQALLLDRFRKTHPEAPREPKLAGDTLLDWYLKPRDAA